MDKEILEILTQNSGLYYCPKCQSKHNLPEEDPTLLGKCEVCKSKGEYLIHVGSYTICFDAGYDFKLLPEPKKI